jgi:putative N6-adenine-specific DNA methylase
MPADFEILLVTAPGHEAALSAEAAEQGFRSPVPITGGVTVTGNWSDVWRANLVLRGAVHVYARIGAFRVLHLAQLDKRARAFPWGDVLRQDVPVRVEATCKSSRIYHSKAAEQRIATAIREQLGATVSDDAALCIKARIDDDLCTISIDTSGGSLHKRGHKEAIAKAPMRETMAAMFLRQCGYSGTEPVLDPMCGAGTLVIEAAEWAAGLVPGRSRTFAFEQLKTFEPAKWTKMRSSIAAKQPFFKFYGSDRDAGAIASSTANAKRAGVSAFTQFEQRAVSDSRPPAGPPGLVIINPPYGARIGNKKPLHNLYAATGQVLRERFKGWRVGLITTDAQLAKSTGLPFAKPDRPVMHGGLRVSLFKTDALT